MTSRRIPTITLLSFILACAACAGPPDQPVEADENVETLRAAPGTPRATIVLVHGGFADGTGWQKVIPLLERDGIR